MDVQDIRAITESVRGELRKAVVGQDEVIELMLTSLLATSCSKACPAPPRP
jgi:MoxR-like ATPase